MTNVKGRIVKITKGNSENIQKKRSTRSTSKSMSQKVKNKDKMEYVDKLKQMTKNKKEEEKNEKT